MIGVIQYGIGNIGSVKNAFKFLKFPCVATGSISELSKCDRLILPGVGAFQPAMEILKKIGMDVFLDKWAKEGKPILGICLGMQLLLSGSEENGFCKGLGIIPGNVLPFQKSKRKVHMGWNKVEPVNNNFLISSSAYAYFVHSYVCQPEDETHIIAKTEYGDSFASAIQNQNIMGVQFHPEKSQDYGLNILRNFANASI